MREKTENAKKIQISSASGDFIMRMKMLVTYPGFYNINSLSGRNVTITIDSFGLKDSPMDPYQITGQETFTKRGWEKHEKYHAKARVKGHSYAKEKTHSKSESGLRSSA